MKLFAKDVPAGAWVLDLDTNRRLSNIIWVDPENGMAEAYEIVNGQMVLTFDSDGAAAWKTLLLKGRFKLMNLPTQDNTKSDFSKYLGAPRCGMCGSTMTLRGDELCPICKAKDSGKPLKAKRLDPFEFHSCEKCSRDATWSVSDEVTVSAEEGRLPAGGLLLGGRYLFDRAVTVNRRYYCSWHYVGPRLVDHKGEIMSTDDSMKHRPQY